jgi:sporulation protein YlmC with PRC-barrel domain
MVHYATLHNYQFDADVDDLRGATLYGEGGAKLGRIEDVVFEHGSGEIEYLVTKAESGRRVLVPVESVRTSVADDRDLDSDLTAEDLASLPAFEENMLKHDETWKRHRDEHRQVLKDRNKAAQREYKREFTDEPVEHQSGDIAHTITPIEVEGSGAPSSRGEDDYVPDLTPQRLAPIFTNTAQTPDKLNMVPNAGMSRGPAADYQTAGLGVKWNGYQERIRRDLPKLRGACETCSDNQSKVA